MADGKIVIDVEVESDDIEKLRKKLTELEGIAKQSGVGIKTTSDAVEKLGNKSDDASGTVKGVADAQLKLADSSDVAASNVKEATDGLDGLAESGDAASSTLKETSQNQDSLSDSSDNSKASIDSLTDSVGSTKDELEQLSSGASKTATEIEGMDSSLSSAESEVSSLGSTVGDAENEIDSMGVSASKTASEMDSMGSDASNVASGVDAVTDSASNAETAIDGLGEAEIEAGKSAEKMKKPIKDAGKETEELGKNSQKSGTSVKDLATSLGLVKIASAAFNVMSSAMDGAISRFDTLNQYPKVLGALGVEADVAASSTKRLAEGIDGLPTTLNEVAANAQQLFLAFGDAETATETTIALNNALLGSGANAGQAQRGFDMYNKALQRGEMNAVTWTTLNETMGTGLKEIAEQFGFAGDSARMDLFKSLQDGSITMTEFNDKLIEVGTGTGKMAGLAQEMSEGIATSFTNLKNSTVRGLTNVVTAVNELSKTVTGKNIAQNLDQLKNLINVVFEVIVQAIQSTEPVLIMFASLIKALVPVVSSLTPVISALTPVILGMVTAFALTTIIQKVTAMVNSSKVAYAAYSAVVKIHTAVIYLWALATKEQTRAELANSVASKASTMFLTVKTALMAIYTTAIGLSTGAVNLATLATTAWGIAIKVLLGPIGWVVLALGALAGAVVGLFKHFNKANEETKKLASETADLAEETKKLNDSVDSSAKAHKENIAKIESSKKVTNQLADEIDNLAKKEDKSAAEKVVLNAKIQELNDSVDGLSLAYDEESNSLSDSIEMIKKRNDAQKEQEKMSALQKRAIELSEEQSAIEIRLTEIQKIKAKQGEDNVGTSKDLKKATEDLIDEEDALRAQLVTTTGAVEANGDMMTETSEKVAKAQEEGVYVQIKSYEELEGAQKTAFDSVKSGYDELTSKMTDSYGLMEEKQALSLEQQTENLKKNLEMTNKWADNLAIAGERVVGDGQKIPDGLIEAIRKGGPEMAAAADVLAHGSDEALLDLINTYEETGKASLTAFAKANNFEESEIPESIRTLITKTDLTMAEEIKLADFKATGKVAPDDTAEGIRENKGVVAEAGVEVIKEAKETTDSAVEESDFGATGEKVTTNTATGITNTTGVVGEAVQGIGNEAGTKLETTLGGYDFMQMGATPGQNLAQGLDSQKAHIEQTSKEMGGSVGDSAKEGVDQKNPTEIGSDFGVDMSTGIDNSIPVAMASARELGKSIVESFKKEIDKLEKVSTKAMSAMDKSFSTGGKTVTSTNKKTASAIPKEYSTLSAAMRTIGTDAMAGLNDGLISGQGAVLATAKATADKIASTMKSALDINSPSRVMRDEVGISVPQGIAKGIEKDAYKIDDAVNDAVQKFSIPTLTAEAALGIDSKMFTNPSSARYSNVTKQPNQVDKMDKLIRLTEKIVDKDPNMYIDSSKVNKSIASGSDNAQGRRVYFSEWGLQI